MNKIKFLVAALAAIGLMACGNKTVSPISSEINGPLGEYFEVVERDYKISDGYINIEFERAWDGGPEGASSNSKPTFKVELLDKDGDVIESSSTDVIFDKEQLENVFSLEVDQTSSIKFHFNKTKGAASIKISSSWNEDAELEIEEIEEVEEIDIDEEYEEDEELASGDIDAFLDSYEQYVTKYVALLKKANSGDMSALSEYVVFLEKAQDISEQLDDLSDDMSISQINRFNKINMKMANALQ